MFEEIDCQYGNVSPTLNCNKHSEKNLVISFSLLMRLFEWCHEDAKDDVEMHKVMEKLVAFNDGVNPLTIDVYDCLINDVNCPNATEEDIDYAYDLGQELANKDCQLNDDGRNYSHVAGEIITTCKDNGCGASNSELESFWNGYNSDEDQRQNSSVITLNDENSSACCAGDMLDTDVLEKIQSIINNSKF